MKKFLTVIIFLIVVVQQGYSKNTLSHRVSKTINVSSDDTLNSKLDENIPIWIQEFNVPGVAVGMIEEGEIKWTKVYGELEKNRPAPSNALFNTASIGKAITATLVLKLVEEGKWDLDESLSNYWIDPEIKDNPWHKILTTRHVLSHRTGFKNWRHYSATNKLEFDFKPGTAHQYSGEGLEYLQKALVNKFQRPFNKLLDSLILKPLQMKDTQYWTDSLDVSRFAYSHDVRGNIYQDLNYNSSVSAAGGLITTVEDLSKFGIHVMNGAGLSPSLYKDMIAHQGNEGGDSGYGLGWTVVKNLPDGEYALKHGGDDRGVHSVLILLPKSKRGIAVFTNGDNGTLIIDKITKELIDLSPPILNPIEIKLDNSIKELYIGKYLQTDGRTLLLEITGNALKMSGEGIPLIELTPETETRFFVKDYGINLEFIKNLNDNSLEMIIFQDGKLVMEAKRVEP